MSRRKLRTPIDPRKLEQHFRVADDLPESLTSSALFGNELPLQIEIGSGKGLFIRTAAAADPETNFLGIEVAFKYAKHAGAGLCRDDRMNGMMVAGDAMPLMESRVPDQSLSAVHVYFPDPWWKKRHKKRRVLSDAMLQHIDRTLMPGGSFHFWTDVLEYFQSVMQRMAEIVPQMGPPYPVEVTPAKHDLDYRTHFERRSRKLDIPVYRVRFDKPAP